MAKKILLLIFSIALVLLTASTALADIPTFTAIEGELLYLSAETFDIDEDTTYLVFPDPFDSDGRWLTDYESAGEYVLTITAIDQEGNQVNQDIRLTIEENNQEPGITENSLTYNEGDLISLTNLITDPDQDILSYSFEEPFNEEGLWQTTYTDAGRHVTNIKISDQEITITKQVEITINEKNAPPTAIEIFQASDSTIHLKENEQLEAFVIASDQENDPITYSWTINNEQISEDPTATKTFDYNTEGQTYTLNLKLADQEDETWYTWTIIISNNNRAPQIKDQQLTITETDNITLDLPVADDDGEEIT